MRRILLSFSPNYYEVLRNGNKVFEYRKRFCNEEVLAYIYLGKPIQKIVGIALLGKRINLSDWYDMYTDENTRLRIKDYMTRNRYAMPIKSYQIIEPIPIIEIKKLFPDFYIPLSFRNLSDEDELTRYLIEHTRKIGTEVIHKFDIIEQKNICEM